MVAKHVDDADASSLISSSPRTAAPNVLSYSVASYPIPFDLLPRYGKLSAQALKGALTEVCEPPVKLFLVLSLACCNLFGDACARVGRHGAGDSLVGQ